MLLRIQSELATHITRAKSPTQIIRHTNVFNPIVDRSLFEKAQQRLSTRWRRLTPEYLIEQLHAAKSCHGHVGQKLLRGTYNRPCSKSYARLFGSLVNAYAAAGIERDRSLSWCERRHHCLTALHDIFEVIAGTIQQQGHTVLRDHSHKILNVDDAWGVHIQMVCARQKKTYPVEWAFKLVDSRRTDLLLLLRLDQAGTKLVDMYLVPTLSIPRIDAVNVMRLNNSLAIDMYRLRSLSDVPSLAERYMADVSTCTPRFGRTLWDRARRD